MSSFTKKAAQATRAIRAEAKRTASRALLVKHPAVREAFEAFPLSMRSSLSLSIAGYSNTVYINATVRGLASFKDEKLTRLLEQFMGDDWKAEVNEYVHSDTPNKDFTFERRVASASPAWDSAADPLHVDTFSIRVSIYAYVKSDSPLCRIVVTGMTERVVREEVKQIVCA